MIPAITQSYNHLDLPSVLIIQHLKIALLVDRLSNRIPAFSLMLHWRHTLLCLFSNSRNFHMKLGNFHLLQVQPLIVYTVVSLHIQSNDVTYHSMFLWHSSYEVCLYKIWYLHPSLPWILEECFCEWNNSLHLLRTSFYFFYGKVETKLRILFKKYY